jgi:DNA-binding transcriptional MocR family regulator
MSASEIRALFAVASRPEVISLAGGMPYVEALPSDEVLDVVRTVLTHRKAEALQYCAGAGLAGLKERVASLMAEEGLVADPQHIVVTEGAQQALDLLGKIFIDPGDEIAVEAPSYVGALSAFSAYQPSFLTVPLDEDGLIVEELEEALVRGARPKFLYTIPNFQNPAGVTLSGERRRHLVTLCREAGILIIEDNPYGLLRFEGEPLPTLASLDPENVIYLGTLSKVFAPAIRVGWALAEPGVIQRLVLAKEAADLCSSALTQVVAEEWLARDWKAPLARLVETYQARRDAMLGTLERSFPEGTSWTHPLGGFYVWVTLPSYLDSSALLAAAVERRVAYVPGTGFYPDGSGRDRLRLAFSYPSEEAIEEGVRRLGELVAEEQDLYRSLSG